MKKHLNKELVMTKKDDEGFESPAKCWISYRVYAEGDVKVRDDCHITRKFRGSPHRYCNIKIKICIVFQKLKNYESHLIMQELGKFDFKINVIPNGLEEYI